MLGQPRVQLEVTSFATEDSLNAGEQLSGVGKTIVWFFGERTLDDLRRQITDDRYLFLNRRNGIKAVHCGKLQCIAPNTAALLQEVRKA
jgi:hypothetical protein